MLGEKSAFSREDRISGAEEMKERRERARIERRILFAGGEKTLVSREILQHQ
jgi:hypothetical protein